MSADPFQLLGGRSGYPGRRVLDGVDFAVRAGEFVTVLGANGSGKTTLLRTLLRLTPLDSGELHLFGQPAPGFRGWRRIGYVPQRAAAPGGVPASVAEVVLSGRTASTRPWRRWTHADRSAVDDALSAVGMSGHTRESVDALSGGQHQRVLIARALAAAPDVLVLDEPNAGIDAESQEALTTTLRQLKDCGTAVILVAHELGPLAELVDRVVVMAHGTVAYDGTDIPAGLHDDTHHHMHHRDVVDGRPWGMP